MSDEAMGGLLRQWEAARYGFRMARGLVTRCQLRVDIGVASLWYGLHF
jgi:hypothetical protein